MCFPRVYSLATSGLVNRTLRTRPHTSGKMVVVQFIGQLCLIVSLENKEMKIDTLNKQWYLF